MNPGPGVDPGRAKIGQRRAPCSKNFFCRPKTSTPTHQMHSNDPIAGGEECYTFFVPPGSLTIMRFRHLFGRSHFDLFERNFIDFYAVKSIICI